MKDLKCMLTCTYTKPTLAHHVPADGIATLGALFQCGEIIYFQYVLAQKGLKLEEILFPLLGNLNPVCCDCKDHPTAVGHLSDWVNTEIKTHHKY